MTSEWYGRYVADVKNAKDKRHFDKCRRRFRMPYHCFVLIFNEARADEWFPSREKCNALGQKGVPLEIILGAFRYSGNSNTFFSRTEN